MNIVDENEDTALAEDERDDDADLSDEELAGDDDAADDKSKRRQTQVPRVENNFSFLCNWSLLCFLFGIFWLAPTREQMAFAKFNHDEMKH